MPTPRRKPTPPPVKRTRVPEEALADRISTRVDQLVAAIRKKYGPDSISRLGDETEAVVGTFPTLPALDQAIGIGGWPLAKVCQISGPPSVGKSALTKKLIACALQAGITPYFIDGEQSKDTPERYAVLDISTRNVAWTEELFLEDAFAKAELGIRTLARQDGYGLVFIDSLMMPLKAEVERGYDDEATRAGRARFFANNIPKLVVALKDTRVGLVFVNQIRQRANALPYQDPNYEPGGYALAHWCHLILRLAPVGRIGRGDTATGVKARVTVRKSKLASPFRTATLNIMFDGSITEADEQE